MKLKDDHEKSLIRIDPVALIITILLIYLSINVHRLIGKTDTSIANQEGINSIFQETPWKVVNGKVCVVKAFYLRSAKDTLNNVFDIMVLP